MSSIVIAVLALCSVGHSEALAAVSVTEFNDPVPLFETFKLEVNAPGVGGQKFLQYPSFTFTKGTRSIVVDGFFNGNGSGNANGTRWGVRFMPNEQGTWNYTWSFDGQSGSGSVTVNQRANPRNHGHVSRSGRFLKTDDGKGFQYMGANWPGALNLRPDPNFSGFTPNCGTDCPYFTDAEWDAYMQRLEDTGHNGTYMTAMENVMNNDRVSFNLAWLQRIDRALEKAGEHGLYAFLTMFNVWGRSANNPFRPDTVGANQIMDPWNGNSNAATKDFFFRYLAARYAGYYNIMWEFGNELDNIWDGPTNSIPGLVSAMNNIYLPAIRRYDPYNIPIQVSDKVLWPQVNVDMGANHSNEEIALNETRPVFHSELVFNGAPQPMWQTTAYRNPAYRHFYRRAMWKGYGEGGSGTIECSIMFFQAAFPSLTAFMADGNIRNVMEDHKRFGTFLNALPADLLEMPPLGPSGMGSSSQQYRSRGKAGSVYMAYFYALGTAPASINLNVSSGSYQARWFSPSTGQYSTPVTVANNANLTSPFSNQFDVALELVSAPADNNAPAPPVGLVIQ